MLLLLSENKFKEKLNLIRAYHSLALPLYRSTFLISNNLSLFFFLTVDAEMNANMSSGISSALNMLAISGACLPNEFGIGCPLRLSAKCLLLFPTKFNLAQNLKQCATKLALGTLCL